MRTIEEKIIETLRGCSGEGVKKLSCRDRVVFYQNKVKYYLCNNLLFWNDSENEYCFTGRGWCSLTTKNRLNTILNAFFDASITQKNYKWVLNWNNQNYSINETNIYCIKNHKLYKKSFKNLSSVVEVLPIENN